MPRASGSNYSPLGPGLEGRDQRHRRHHHRRPLGDHYTPTQSPYTYEYATGVSDNHQRQAWSVAFLLVVLVPNFGIRLVTGRRVVQASRAD